ncbi:hypothetical protein ACVWXO_003634 [Bradyrhizobium sp. LM2.7]
MPSALRSGASSAPRNCDRNATNPAAAPTKANAIVDTTAARSQPRGRFGD